MFFATSANSAAVTPFLSFGSTFTASHTPKDTHNLAIKSQASLFAYLFSPDGVTQSPKAY